MCRTFIRIAILIAIFPVSVMGSSAFSQVASQFDAGKLYFTGMSEIQKIPIEGKDVEIPLEVYARLVETESPYPDESLYLLELVMLGNFKNLKQRLNELGEENKRPDPYQVNFKGTRASPSGNSYVGNIDLEYQQWINLKTYLPCPTWSKPLRWCMQEYKTKVPGSDNFRIELNISSSKNAEEQRNRAECTPKVVEKDTDGDGEKELVELPPPVDCSDFLLTYRTEPKELEGVTKEIFEFTRWLTTRIGINDDLGIDDFDFGDLYINGTNFAPDIATSLWLSSEQFIPQDNPIFRYDNIERLGQSKETLKLSTEDILLELVYQNDLSLRDFDARTAMGALVGGALAEASVSATASVQPSFHSVSSSFFDSDLEDISEDKNDLLQVSEEKIIQLSDLDTDGDLDLAIFESDGVHLITSQFHKSFTSEYILHAFGSDDNAGGWRLNQHPRYLCDVNGDGLLDIVGFGREGVFVSTAQDDEFSKPELWIQAFGYDVGGWRVGHHPRILADVNNDGMDDIVGFGSEGVWVSLSKGSYFAHPILASQSFGYLNEAGGWRSGYYPRILTDLNGDTLPDIVGLGRKGVYAAHGTGGYFLPAKLLWNSVEENAHPGDIIQIHSASFNNDELNDLVFLTDNDLWIGLSNVDGLTIVDQIALVTSESERTLHIEDLNRDGTSEVVLIDGKGVGVIEYKDKILTQSQIREFPKDLKVLDSKVMIQAQSAELFVLTEFGLFKLDLQ